MRLRIFASARGGATYDRIAHLARHVEQCGFDGFFQPDHYVSVAGNDGNPVDVWTTIAGLTRDTSTIRLGSMVSAARGETAPTCPLKRRTNQRSSHGSSQAEPLVATWRAHAVNHTREWVGARGEARVAKARIGR